MAKYRKKPTEIEAIRYGPHTTPSVEVQMFLAGTIWRLSDEGITIPTLAGDLLVQPGDWLTRTPEGEVYPCKNDIFQAIYEPA